MAKIEEEIMASWELYIAPKFELTVFSPPSLNAFYLEK